MPCYHPIQGYLETSGDGSRKFKACPVLQHYFESGETPRIELLPNQRALAVPCGRCVGCRLDRSRQWAVRCMHEASLHDDSCFLTLTYDDEHLPHDMSLDVSHFQKFFKRLRKKHGSGIRYFHCGEYGDKYKRPHYHALVFGFDFVDKSLFQEVDDVRLYISDDLDSLWGKGFCTLGDVTFESAAYVARYVCKKVTGDEADYHYQYTCPDTGEVYLRAPEYATMSRRPGIGTGWLDSFMDDVYPSDEVIVNGKPCKPPRFYDDKFKAFDPEAFLDIELAREYNAERFESDNTAARLAVKKKIQIARSNQLVRTLDQ